MHACNILSFSQIFLAKWKTKNHVRETIWETEKMKVLRGQKRSYHGRERFPGIRDLGGGNKSRNKKDEPCLHACFRAEKQKEFERCLGWKPGDFADVIHFRDSVQIDTPLLISILFYFCLVLIEIPFIIFFQKKKISNAQIGLRLKLYYYN